MVEVIKVTPEMFEQIYPLLTIFQKNNPGLTREHWWRVFHYPWQAPDDLRGFALRDGDRFVGFIALIQHQREIDGKLVRLANHSSWVVLPEYRHSSVLLSYYLSDLTDLNMTILSQKKEMDLYNRALGAKDLETAQKVILPLPSLAGLSSSVKFHVTTDLEKHLEQLSPTDRQIYLDHRTLDCQHLLALDDSGYCYVVSVRTKGRRRQFAHVLYISDPQRFVAALERIKPVLLFRHRALLAMLDERLLRGVPLPQARHVPLAVPRLYQSSSLRPEQIDNLYSEMVLLPS